MPGRVEALARLPVRIANLEKKIERLNGKNLTSGESGDAPSPTIANTSAAPAAIDASGRSAPGATNSTSTADVEAAKAAFNEYLGLLLNRPLASQTYGCRCCGKEIDLSAREPLDATCFISGLSLRRYKCPHCSVVFGPVQLIECSGEELGRVYELLYGFLHEGDSRIGQEKAFYCTDPGFSERILNYACGDWDSGLARLRDIGWNVEGYEPFQPNSSPHIYAHRDDVPQKAYDALFSHNYLEHVQDPLAFFSECLDYIHPDGRMAHSTPCYSYVFEQSPLHLHFVLPDTVLALAENTGLTVSGHFASDLDSEHTNIHFECYVFKLK